jgi:hypothetical protein
MHPDMLAPKRFGRLRSRSRRQDRFVLSTTISRTGCPQRSPTSDGPCRDYHHLTPPSPVRGGLCCTMEHGSSLPRYGRLIHLELHNGPARELERLPAPFPRVLPDPALSGDVGGYDLVGLGVDLLEVDTIARRFVQLMKVNLLSLRVCGCCARIARGTENCKVGRI